MVGLRGVFALQGGEDDTFHAGAVGEGGARVYGGHMLAQALLAAYATVDGMICHSHCTRFLRPGHPEEGFSLAVTRTFDGRRFAVRQTVVRQRDRPVIMAISSFQHPVDGATLQEPARAVGVAPEQLASELVLAQPFVERLQAGDDLVPTLPSGIDGRWVDPQDYADPVPKPRVRDTWLRVTNGPAASLIERQIGTAFLSDYAFIETALRPLGRSWFDPATAVASLEHNIWFHRDGDPTSWLLCQSECLTMQSECALVRGELRAVDGRLLASLVQEGMLRAG